MDELVYSILTDTNPVTYTQGGREWFLARKFHLTASQSEKQVTLALKDKNYSSKTHWKTIADTVKFLSSPPPAIEHATEGDAREWAQQILTEQELCDQVGDYDGYTKHLDKKMKEALMQVKGQTNIKKACLWCKTDPKYRDFVGLSLAAQKRNSKSSSC